MADLIHYFFVIHVLIPAKKFKIATMTNDSGRKAWKFSGRYCLANKLLVFLGCLYRLTDQSRFRINDFYNNIFKNKQFLKYSAIRNPDKMAVFVINKPMLMKYFFQRFFCKGFHF